MTWLTPPAVARLLAVRPSKVLTWIAAGELTAVDVSERQGGRPRWRISSDDLAAFLGRRQARPQQPTTRRQRTDCPDYLSNTWSATA